MVWFAYSLYLYLFLVWYVQRHTPFSYGISCSSLTIQMLSCANAHNLVSLFSLVMQTSLLRKQSKWYLLRILS